MAKKDEKTRAEAAASKATGGCTLTLFGHAHAFHSQKRKKNGKEKMPLKAPSLPPTPPRVVLVAHQEFETLGKVPFWVQNFYRAGHHMRIAA